MYPQNMPLLLHSTSWSAVFAGSVTALAISFVMGILGVALGFTVVDPKSDEPASGLGKAMGLWSALSVIVSMAAGGFMAGLLTWHRGVEHAFLVWALVTIVALCFGSSVMGSAMRAVGSVVRGFGSGAAQAASGVGKGAAHAATAAMSELKDNLNLHLDTDKLSDKLNENVTEILRDTGVETLQPDYLKQQITEARADLRKVVRQIGLHPSDMQRLLTNFVDAQKDRLSRLTENVDKDTAVTALMQARNIPEAEARQLVDNAVTAYNRTVSKARESLNEVNAQVEEAKDHMKEMADQARNKADKLSSTAAKAAVAAAIALILAALISMGAGALGSHCAQEWYEYPHKYMTRR